MTLYGRAIAAAVSAVLILATASTGRAAPDPERASRFVVSGLARAMALMDGERPSRDDVARRLRKIFREGVDIRTMAASALGPASRRLTESQKRRYLDAFETQIVQTYTLHLLGARPSPGAAAHAAAPDPHEMIRIKGTTPLAPDQIMVHTKVNQPGVKWMTVDWRLRKKGDRFLIVDIVIDGISQVQLYQSVFAAVIQRHDNGIEALINALEQLNGKIGASPQAVSAAMDATR